MSTERWGGSFKVASDLGPDCDIGRLGGAYRGFLGKVEWHAWRWKDGDFEEAFRLHGRVGGFRSGEDLINALKNTAIDLFMHPTNQVVSLADKFGIGEILIHTAEAERTLPDLLAFAGVVCVENSAIKKFGWERTVKYCQKLAVKGVKTKMVADAGHFAREMGTIDQPELALTKFVATCRNLKPNLKNSGVGMEIHLPLLIDPLVDDAFDLSRLSNGVLEKLFGVFGPAEVEMESLCHFWGRDGGKRTEAYKRKIYENMVRLGKIGKAIWNKTGNSHTT